MSWTFQSKNGFNDTRFMEVVRFFKKIHENNKVNTESDKQTKKKKDKCQLTDPSLLLKKTFQIYFSSF